MSNVMRAPAAWAAEGMGAVRDVIVRMATDRRAAAAGLVMLGIGVGFVFAYRAVQVRAPDGELAHLLALGRDGALPELYGYLLALIVAGGLVAAWWRTGVLAYAVGALAFVFVFADDAFMYHERVGRRLAARADIPALPGLRAQDTGELIAWGAAGLVLAALLAWSAAQRTGTTVRVLTLLGGMIAALGVFGAGMDMLHIYSGRGLFTYIEDGGELVVLALSAWAAIAVARAPWRGVLRDDAASDAWRGLRTRMGRSAPPEPAGVRAGPPAAPRRA